MTLKIFVSDRSDGSMKSTDGDELDLRKIPATPDPLSPSRSHFSAVDDLRTCSQPHLPTQNHTIPAKIGSPLVDVTTVTSPRVEPILSRNGAILISERDCEQILTVSPPAEKMSPELALVEPGAGEVLRKSSINQSRIMFLQNNDINPQNTTLVRLKYNSGDYKRYFTVDDQYMGDGIIKESNLVSDALVVTEPNHALFLPLADCIGAVLHDPRKNILMVSHLGRHNLEQQGGIESVNYLIKHHGVNPNDLTVWLGPAAGGESYPLFAFNNRSLHDVATEQFEKAGVLSENITVSPIDTSKDEKYYSHSQFLKGRREDDGRFAIVAVMK